MQQGQTDAIKDFLRFSAHFREYSTGNQLLIAAQCPNATKVASLKIWNELGYHIREGQKSIKVLAPSRRKRRREQVITSQDDGSEVVELTLATILKFVPVPVFDASQLVEIEERPLPEFFHPIGEGYEEHVAQLTLCAQAAAFHVIYALTDNAKQHINAPAPQGYLTSDNYIVIRRDLDSTNRFLTLTHEYGHGLHRHLPRGMRGKVAECQAEATAFLVVYNYGIESPFSSDYLQNWGNTLSDFLAELDEVQAVATRIMTELDARHSLHDPIFELKMQRRTARAQKAPNTSSRKRRSKHTKRT